MSRACRELTAMRPAVVAVGVTALLAACGGGGPAPTRTASSAAALQPTRSSPSRVGTCITSGGYGGLGAYANAFDANNNDSTGPAEPTPGAAWYQVMRTRANCITAYSVQDSGTPALGSRDMLFLVSRDQPRDAKLIAIRPRCAVWKSPSLRRATGMSYAKARAAGQANGFPGAAEIEATSNPAC